MAFDFVLYCKSYRRDFLRLERLLTSIEQHNVDRIPLYISTPTSDRDALFEIVGEGRKFHWVGDEEIVICNPGYRQDMHLEINGGLSQQVIKAEFWRLRIASNYLCIDSDSLFIRDFRVNDFLAEDGFPYTVLHQNKELFQMAENRGHLQVQSDLMAESVRVKTMFARVGPNYYCAPSPFIWSAKVWESLDLKYLRPKGITLWDVVTPQIPESLLYGEALLAYEAIPVRAIEPLFRVYHYDWQFYLLRRMGETQQKLINNFMGLIYQSAWESELHYGPSSKPLTSRLIKRLKRFFRRLQSIF